ncbi:unnamed protein product [Soboliphyme baturini]|uniref:Rab-GAP TBC domain-containing protein n=1 Tax=Soboliphyme baturini TaxID=241478 RepID=A0A183IDD0_9BILA|nr:unnamed protein product [Soboliphyme baturini]
MFLLIVRLWYRCCNTYFFLNRLCIRSRKEDNYVLLTVVDKGKAFRQTLAELMKDTSPNLFTVSRLPERPEIERDQPMSLDEWRSFRTDDGSFRNVKTLKQRIFRGGLVPEIRAEAWTLLLGVYPWQSTEAERKEIRMKNTEYYEALKAQWKAVTADQETRWSHFRERKMLIGDVPYIFYELI